MDIFFYICECTSLTHVYHKKSKSASKHIKCFPGSQNSDCVFYPPNTLINDLWGLYECELDMYITVKQKY